MTHIYPLDATMAQDTSPEPDKSSSLYALAIELAAADRTVVPASLGRALYSQVMNWLSLEDSELANSIHNNQNTPFSLSALKGFRRKSGTKAGDEFCFRIALLKGNLIHPLLAGLDTWGNKPISLAKRSFVLRAIYSIPESHPEVSSADYYLLAKAPKAFDDITLQFLTPTSFKQEQHIQPFPLTELVFGSLLRRWNTFAPEDLHFPPVLWQGLISAFDIKTHALKMEGGAQIGAVGWVRYRFPDPKQAEIATTLAYFANFAGVGRKTATGMGQVKFLPETNPFPEAAVSPKSSANTKKRQLISP